MLAEHEPGFRRTWMFPRNIRRIHPWKMAQILALFSQHAQQDTWSGNQRLQNRFRLSLEHAGLIRAGAPYDPNSGGPRTYQAQLKSLGLIFERSDRTTWLTRAGEDISRGTSPLPIIQRQLLRHQYPSAYGALRGVKVNPRLKVKPFLFIKTARKPQAFKPGDEWPPVA